MSDECCESKKNMWYELGKVAMLEDLANEYAKLAGVQYGQRQFDLARHTMGVADDLKSRAEGARRIYSMKYKGDSNG